MTRRNPSTDQRLRDLERKASMGDANARAKLDAMLGRLDPMQAAWNAWVAKPSDLNLRDLVQLRREAMGDEPYTMGLWRGAELLWSGPTADYAAGNAVQAFQLGARNGDHVLVLYPDDNEDIDPPDHQALFEVVAHPSTQTDLANLAGVGPMLDNLNDMGPNEAMELYDDFHAGDPDNFTRDDYDALAHNYTAYMVAEALGRLRLKTLGEYADRDDLNAYASHLGEEELEYQVSQQGRDGAGALRLLAQRAIPLADVEIALNGGMRRLELYE